MKIITQFALACFLYLVAFTSEAQNIRTTTNNAQDTDIFYHTVERDQTVYSIAKMYDIMVIDIHNLNPGSENVIKEGDRLKIPRRSYSVNSILNNDNTSNSNNSNSNSNNSSSSSSGRNNSSDDGYITHTIKKNETPYGLSKQYNITQESIYKANPGLTSTNFPEGKTIRIPKFNIVKSSTQVVEREGEKEVYYLVPNGETPYNICKTYKTTEAELLRLNPELAGGLRAGMTIRIPLRISENDLPNRITPTPSPVLPTYNRENMIRIALLLPINAEDLQWTEVRKDFIEYLEGFLLAIDTLRSQGYLINLIIEEIGENNVTKTRRVLREKAKELANAHLIIGGFSVGNATEQIKLIADFAKQNKAKYVIPISRTDEALDNEYVFQVNTPPPYLYGRVAYAGANLFAKYNIIFLDTKEEDEKDDQSEFIKIFKQELRERHILYKEAAYEADKFEENITSLLSTSKPNVIMPISQSVYALQKIKTTLRMITETKPEYNLSLFGYPVWQQHFEDCFDCPDDFHALNTYIFSYSFVDNLSPSVQAFYEIYRGWYNKSQSPYIRKTALLGYDTGLFFIKAIQNYGSNFEERISEISHKSLLAGFNFERINESGGFLNKNIFIIHYNKDFKIIRSEFK